MNVTDLLTSLPLEENVKYIALDLSGNVSAFGDMPMSFDGLHYQGETKIVEFNDSSLVGQCGLWSINHLEDELTRKVATLKSVGTLIPIDIAPSILKWVNTMEDTISVNGYSDYIISILPTRDSKTNMLIISEEPLQTNNFGNSLIVHRPDKYMEFEIEFTEPVEGMIVLLSSLAPKLEVIKIK